MTLMQSLGALNRQYEANMGSKDLGQLAMFLAKANGSLQTAAKLADASSETSSRLRSVFKAAVAAGTSSDSTFLGPLVQYRPLTDGFLESLRTRSIFDAALPDMTPIPLKTRLLVVSGGLASVVSEGSPAPLTKLSLSAGTVDPIDVVALVAVSQELLRFGDKAAALLELELKKGVALQSDIAFLSTITSGVSSVPSHGESSSDFLVDLRNLLGAVSIGAGVRPYLALHPALVRALATKETSTGAIAFPEMTITGGEIAGVQILPSDAQAAGTGTMLDASQMGADGGSVVINATKEGSLQMSDSPSGAAPLVSLFQTNSIAIRAVREFGFVRGRTTAVACLVGANYDDQSSGV